MEKREQNHLCKCLFAIKISMKTIGLWIIKPIVSMTFCKLLAYYFEEKIKCPGLPFANMLQTAINHSEGIKAETLLPPPSLRYSHYVQPKFSQSQFPGHKVLLFRRSSIKPTLPYKINFKVNYFFDSRKSVMAPT